MKMVRKNTRDIIKMARALASILTGIMTVLFGKLIFHIFGALAEFERDIIRDRTKAGLDAARKRGRIGGRPKKMDEKKIALAKSLLSENTNSFNEICEMLKVSKATLYRYLKKE